MTAQQQNALKHAHESERCHHFHLTGRQCGSPALSGHRLCYYHQQTRRPKLPNYQLPLLEDAASVQFGLVQVARALEDKAYDAKTGALLLYALQTASANLRRLYDEREQQRHADERERSGSSMSTESFADIMIRGLGLRPPDEAESRATHAADAEPANAWPPQPFPNPLADALDADALEPAAIEDPSEQLSEGPYEEPARPRPAANVHHEPSFDEVFPLDPPAPAPPTRRGPASETPRPAGLPRRRGPA